MGSKKSGGSSSSSNQSGSSTTTPQPTAEERELQKLELDRRRNVQPQLLQTDQQLLNLIEPLTRGQLLEGTAFGSLGQGISPEAQERITQQSLEQIRPGFQQSGLLDSGTRASLESRLAGDIGVQAEMQRQQELQNLLGFAFGAPAQAQQPMLAETAMLSQRLAGLRPTTSTFGARSQSFTPQSGGGGFSFGLF